MRKRGDGRKWFIARRVISILVELAACPLTPEQIRSKTGMTQSHYLNLQNGIGCGMGIRKLEQTLTEHTNYGQKPEIMLRK